MSESHEGHSHKLSAAGVLIALGIIYGDIGTSPLYVFKAIIGDYPISKELVYGGMSAIFWTLTIITSFKYVYLALNADNRGEGGIFALYALVRRFPYKWVIFPTIIGSCTLLADGFITPPISISSAVEGLQSIQFLKDRGIEAYILPLVVVIIISLFFVQQFGTQKIGSYFGPVMMVWFTMLTVLGLMNLRLHPEVITALNPYYAFRVLMDHPIGFALLGGVFLCTTGAEALYSDLGHCGKKNTRIGWIFVKIALIINYLGQAAWLMSHEGETIHEAPFYSMIPVGFRPYAVLIATCATIIASQALITGTFTLANEAMKFKLWPNMKVNYPSQFRGQIYIPAMNWILMTGCLVVVAIFQKSENMEAAYGLAITVNLLMTSSLLTLHLYGKHRRDKNILKNKYTVYAIIVLIPAIELCFFLSNAGKFWHGGWFTCLVSTFLIIFMLIFYKARVLRTKYYDYSPMSELTPILSDIIKDYTIPKEATNLVYLANSNHPDKIDKNIIYSITKKRPKRADIYWFLHVDIADEPNTKEYSVMEIIPRKVFFVRLKFGFKVPHKVSLMFRYVVDEMVKNGRVDILSHYPSLKKHKITSDFKFIMINSRVSVDEVFSVSEQFTIKAYRAIKNLSLSPIEQFGLESTNVEEE
ncbi:MAG: KUP/HAK/KT family potassium transporter, partial [Bacteroidia bacterium]|nr:KUP/HAK/KT family potassium transporter [Bacteroidia bacterium]